MRARGPSSFSLSIGSSGSVVNEISVGSAGMLSGECEVEGPAILGEVSRLLLAVVLAALCCWKRACSRAAIREERASMVAFAVALMASIGGRWGVGRTTIGSQRHR